MTVVKGRFEWDDKKNEINIQKHGISFDEILPVFDDPLFYEEIDSENSTIDEARFFGIGKINGFTIIATCFTEQERIRIISSRISTAQEEKQYEQWCKQFFS